MSDSFKIPFSKSKRNSLALDLVLDAQIAANAANKARTISVFIEQYDILLDRFKKLSKLNGKVNSVKGNLSAEYWRLQAEFQKHFRDAIDRSGDHIIENKKGLYKYDSAYIRRIILEFKSDIEKYNFRADESNKEFASAKFRFVCCECGMRELITGEDHSQKQEKNWFLCDSEVEKIIKEEIAWRNKMKGITPAEIQLEQIDKMAGEEFEIWCSELLSKIGFLNVSVTKLSGDQGADVLAEKDGIKYAIQCKCYSSNLGNSPIQEVNTAKAIYHCHVGVVMTNQHFTPGAKQAAEATGILLWDREKLIEMINNSVNE